MKITRKTNVSVKTVRRLIVQQPASEMSICCEQCAEKMITAQSSAVAFSISSREIYRLIEKNKIHFVETETNEIYVCPASVNRILTMLDD